MENNEIMKRLLQDDKSSNPAEKAGWANVKANANDASISKIRVVTAKYKVYIVLILIFAATLLVKYIPNISDAYDADQKAYIQAKNQLTMVERDIEIAKQDMKYLCDGKDWVVTNEEALKKCLNEERDCSSLPESWKKWEWEESTYDYIIPLSYLQLHSLYNKKMPVDEKRVLKNLNEYLIKQDISWEDKRKVWDILRIEIWDPEAVNQWDEHFFQVTVDVEIEFDTVDDLIGFLYNIEKKLINDSEDRILYKIQTVSYDIVTNDEPQITDIEMIAYYYHDERFNDMTECSDNISNNSTESISEDSLDSEDSSNKKRREQKNDNSDFDSLYQEVFKDLEK